MITTHPDRDRFAQVLHDAAEQARLRQLAALRSWLGEDHELLQSDRSRLGVVAAAAAYAGARGRVGMAQQQPR